MRPRKVKKALPEIPFKVGLNLATIVAVKYSRRSNGEIVTDGSGSNPVILITFKVGELKYTESFHTTQNAQWIWDSLSKSLDVKGSGDSIQANSLKDQNLWIVIAAKVYPENNDLRRNMDGSIYMTKQMRMKFYRVFNESSDKGKPIINGDPEINNGIPSGIFLINEDIDLVDFPAIAKLSKNEV